MIESSRFNNQPAWFYGNTDDGDYYDQSHGQYLGSWSRERGNFIDDSKAQQNLFESDDWINRDTKTQTPTLPAAREVAPSVAQTVTNLISLFNPRGRGRGRGPDPLRLPGRYVAFVGDSFCAHVDSDRFRRFYAWQHDMQSRPRAEGPCWSSLVVDALKCNLAPYGFGGRSWWYSWQKFWRDWEHRLDELEAVIFCHTDFTRLNNAENDDIPHTFYFNSDEGCMGPKTVQGLEFWHSHLLDIDFQRWCQQQFFQHLASLMLPFKMLHFFSINFPSEKTLTTLPGIKFTLPLVLLSAAEDDSLLKDWASTGRHDLRANHFNDHNNKAMAWTVIDALEDYRPGVRALDINEFDIYSHKNFKKSLSKWREEPYRVI